MPLSLHENVPFAELLARHRRVRLARTAFSALNKSMNRHTPQYDETPSEQPVAGPTPVDRAENVPAIPSDDTAVSTGSPEPSPNKTTPKVKSSLAGGTWAALIIGALLLILLLVFILQNQQSVELNLFVWSFEFPAGIGYLFSAITGALIMALVGGVRMLELRRQLRKKR